MKKKSVCSKEDKSNWLETPLRKIGRRNMGMGDGQVNSNSISRIAV